jgi:hypothetical protein
VDIVERARRPIHVIGHVLASIDVPIGDGLSAEAGLALAGRLAAEGSTATPYVLRSIGANIRRVSLTGPVDLPGAPAILPGDILVVP